MNSVMKRYAIYAAIGLIGGLGLALISRAMGVT